MIKPLSEIKIWLTIIIIYYYFCNHRWSVLKCRFIFIISLGYLIRIQGKYDPNFKIFRFDDAAKIFSSNYNGILEIIFAAKHLKIGFW